MGIVRGIYYFLNSIYINISKKNVKVSLFSQIKPKSIIGEFVKISKGTFVAGEVGDYTYIGPECRLYAKIGKFCSIAPNVKIINATHPVHMISTSPVFFSPRKQCGYTLVSESKFEELLYVDNEKKYACIIGNDVWIGENVTLKGGIVIGDGAIIAMGAVVTKDVPPYSVFGGVPAKEISKRFDEEKIEYLSNLAWWDKPRDWIEENRNLFLDSNRFFEEAD